MPKQVSREALIDECPCAATEAAVRFSVQDGAGRRIECGPTADVFTSPKDPLAAAYVGGTRG